MPTDHGSGIWSVALPTTHASPLTAYISYASSMNACKLEHDPPRPVHAIEGA